MVLNDLKSTPDQRGWGALLDIDHVVRHQTVSSQNQIQCTFALPDSALPQDEDPDPKDIHEHTMDAARGREFLFQELSDPLNEIGRVEMGSE
jgi:hypothetical protein